MNISYRIETLETGIEARVLSTKPFTHNKQMMERTASCLMTRFSRFNSLLTTQIRTHTTTDVVVIAVIIVAVTVVVVVVMAVIIVAITIVATRTLFNLVLCYNSTISNSIIFMGMRNAHGYIFLFHHIH